MPKYLKKKYGSGEGSLYMSRGAALRYLQLTLRDFRKLCILKGIYPREPRNRKVAQKGAPGIKTMYAKKDIQFLLAEPIIWQMRKFRVHYKKMGKARTLKNLDELDHYYKTHPTLSIDHIVKERYPSFTDALRDLDDCLTLLFLFSTFPSLSHVPRDQGAMCRRLTIEFLHIVISARALRKVFVSIKGYYYQVELRGETITWIVPHHFGFEPQNNSEVDFKVMSHFIEFYITMLGFVNFRLYQQLNLNYPPKLSQLSSDEIEKTLVDEEAFVSERIASLNVELAKSGAYNPDEADQELDQFPMSDDPQQAEKVMQEMDKKKKLKKLFEGLKIFVNREVPREPIVLCVRALGGEVSWDKTLFVGSTFDEKDESITHQIIDRPHMDKQYISRYYVQPQWVFDSVNAAELQPVERYLIGVTLPPHLSPFLDETRDQRYKPPEELLQNLEDPSLKTSVGDESEDESEEESEQEDGGDSKPDEDEDCIHPNSSDVEADVDLNRPFHAKEDKKSAKVKKINKMAVSKGTLYKENPAETKEKELAEFRLQEKMVPNKYRRLYRSMMKGRQKRQNEVALLTSKRSIVEKQEKQKKKKEKQDAKKSAALFEA